MQETQLQLSSSGQSSYQPQPVPSLQDKAETLSPEPQHEPPTSRETLLQQPDKDKVVPHPIPRLRALVDSQTFKNVLVDEMDMMQAHAATLIQSNWRRYRLRRKLISQLLAAKAIQEAWRHFSTKRLLRAGKVVKKKVSVNDKNIPYHPPQQVRFQHSEEGKYLPASPVMVSRETQFPPADSLAAGTHQLAQMQPPGTPQAPRAPESPSLTFLPHQTVSVRLPYPVSLDSKCHQCLLTRTVRSASLVHVEGDKMKTKQGTARTNKAGAPGPRPSGRCAQAHHRPLKTQTQAPVEVENFKASPQTCPAPAMTKTPLQPCPVPTIVMTKTPPQTYPEATVTKIPPQSCLESMMNKVPPQPYPAPTLTIAKTPSQVYPAAPVAKTSLQSCLMAILNKIPTQPCPVPVIMIRKTPPQPCPPAPMTKTSVQMGPTASVTSTASQTRPAAQVAKIPPQVCPLTSYTKPPTQTCPVPTMAKTPPQTCPVPTMAKTPPQTCPVPTMAKTPPQTCPVPTMAKTPPQTCPVPTMAKTPPQTCPVPTMAKTPLQMCPVPMMAKTPLQTCPAPTMAKTPSQISGASVTKTPPQTRLAAMITKTPAQLRSVATILRTLCLAPPAARNLKALSPEAMAAGIPNTLSHTCVNSPEAKAMVTARQTAGVVKVLSHSHLTKGKVKYCPSPPLGSGAPKAPARPFLEAKKIKAFSQKQVKTATVSHTCSVAMEVAKDKNAVSSQAPLRTDVKVQSQVPVPIERAVVFPQTQLAPCSTTMSPQRHVLTTLPAALPQAHVGTCLSKTPPQAHPPAKVTTLLSLARPSPCLTKTQSQSHLAPRVIKGQSPAYLPTGLTKAQSQAQLVPETAKYPYASHQMAELSSKAQSQPLLTGFKASTQPCQHASSFGTLSRANPEDRLTQLPAHNSRQGKATQESHQEASKTQSTLVPQLTSSGQPTCDVESWGDSGAARAQPSPANPATPSQEEREASRLASLCAELAAVLSSQQDLRTLLVKVLSQGEVRAVLNQALSKEILGAAAAKALPQSTLGTELMKALSWGELGVTLSRVLSRGELQAELTKAMQGNLVDVLSKALTEEERAALGQALCQGELGAVLSQSLSQVALSTGLSLPKATAAKPVGSRMMATPAPVEVDCRGNPSAAWGPTHVGPVRPQPSKVRVPQDGAWEGFITDWPTGLLGEMGDGAMVGGSPCLSVVSVGTSLTSRVITTILQYPLVTALDSTLSGEMGPRQDSSLNLFLSPKVREEAVCLHPGAGKLASNLNPQASDAGPRLPQLPLWQLPPHLWQPLVANGIAPSTSRPSVASGTAPSSHEPHVASRVAPHLSASSGEGRVAPAKLAGSAGGGKAAQPHQCGTTFGGSACWCQSSRVSGGPSVARDLQQPPGVAEETLKRTQSPNHKRASVGIREIIRKMVPGLPWATTVSKVPLTQPQTPKGCDKTPAFPPGSLAPGHRWALKSQRGDPSLWEASLGSQLMPTLPHTALPGQEKHRTRGTSSGACCPQELVTDPIPSGLVAHWPQNSGNDLARSFCQGSPDYVLNVRNSKSSLCSYSSLSPSTMSVDKLTAVDLVGVASWEASSDGDLLSGEAMGRSQRPGNLEEMERVGHGHVTPNLHHPRSPVSELVPILHHSAVSSHVTLSVHWGSAGQDERDMSSNQSAMGLKESLFQKPNRTGLKRSLSWGHVAPRLCQQPSVTSRLTPSSSQPSVASEVAPNPVQLSVTCGPPPSLSEPSLSYKVTLSLGQPSEACGVAPSLAQPSITSGMTPSLDHAAMGNSVPPSLGQPPVMSGMGHALSQPTWGPEVDSDLSSRVNVVAPYQSHPSFLTEVLLSAAHPSGPSGIGPGLSQLSVTTGVDPHQDPLLGRGVTSNLQAPELSKVLYRSHHPLGVGGQSPSTTEHSAITVSAPNLYQLSVTSGEDSCPGQGARLSQGILFGTMATSMSQGTMAASMLSDVSWGTLAAGKFLSMSRGHGLTRSVCQRCVSAAGPGQLQVGSGMAPMTSPVSVAHPPLVHEQASGLGPGFCPALVSSGLLQSLPKFSLAKVGPSIPQVNVDLPVSVGHQCPPVSTVTASSNQKSNAFSQEPVMGMVSPLVPGSVANRITTAMASGTVASGITPSFPPGSMIRGVVPSLPPGYMVSCVAHTLPSGSVINSMDQGLHPRSVISGMGQGLPPGSVISGMGQGLHPRSVISGMGQGLPPGSMISGMGQGLPPGSVISGMGQGLHPGSVISGMGQGLPPGSVISGMGQSLHVGSVISDMGQGLPPGSMISGMGQDLHPGSVISGMGQDLHPGSVISGMGQGLPPGSVISGMGQGLPPGSVISGMDQGLHAGSVISGMGQGLPPGSVISVTGQCLCLGCVISSMGQGLSPDSMASAVAHSLPPGSVVSGVAQSFPSGFIANGMPSGTVVNEVPPRLIVASGAGGKRQRLSVRPSASLTSPNLLLDSMASGVNPRVSSVSVASSVAPAFMAGGLNQGLVLGSTASAVGPPTTIGSMAPSLPQGSLLIGLTPRPYHRALARVEFRAPFPASHATGLAQVHPQALEDSGRARGVYQVPTVLQRASQLGCTLGTMGFETRDGQVMMKPEDLGSQGSRSSKKSVVFEAIPRASESLLAPDIDYGSKFLTEDRTVPKGQRLPLEEVAEGQAKSMTSGTAPVSSQPPSFSKYTKATSVTPTWQQKSAISWGLPRSNFLVACEVPSVKTGSVKGTGAPLAHQASVVHIVPCSPLATNVPQSPSDSHMPKSHSHGMVASTIISASHKLAHSSSVAPSLHLGSMSGMGTPSTSQRSGTTGVASHVLPYPSKGSRAEFGGLQIEAVPSALWKPVSGNLSQSSHHQSLGPGESCRFMHDSFVSRMLDGSMAKTEPSQQVGEHGSRSAWGGPKSSEGAPPAIAPIICTGDLVQNMTIPRLHHGVWRVGLGYESPPSGSPQPLFSWELLQGPQDFHSTVTPVDSHRAPLTPTVLQGPVDTGMAGGQAWNSTIPSVMVGPMNGAVAPGGVWEPASSEMLWNAVSSEAAEDPKRSGKLVASVLAVEKIIMQAVVTIQACVRGYLVRRTIKVWHQWAVIIQAVWRGHCVRRDLTQLCRAATVIQALWRGYCIRRKCTQEILLSGTWSEVSGEDRSASNHRCFQSCQPHICALCQSLNPGMGRPPSVVMLLGSSPRTCHMCGHTLPTRVVQGIGRGTTDQAGMLWDSDTQLTHQNPWQLLYENKAAMTIQSAWRGFVVRNQLRKLQVAAKVLQATWRGHHTRASLTTDALLGPTAWDNPQNM